MTQSFKDKVYFACALVPKGKVSTYSAIAKAVNSPKSARAVGNALNKNPDTKKVPCHRVIRSDGFVGGYALGAACKIKKLKMEGVLVSNKGFIDLKKFGA
jgi:methylated-DNA-[protein]-cysteine S-methyltransferase